MKKFFGFLVKRKQNQGKAYSLYDVSLPDNVDNVTQKNGYKHYQFDSDCPGSDACVSSCAKIKDGCSPGCSQIFPSTLTELLDLDDVQRDKVSELSASSSGSDDVKQEQTTPGLVGGRKTRKNTFVITISNSKYFHIGSQKTINIGEKALHRVQVQAQPSLADCSLESDANLSKLLDCEDKLTEECIALISHHADDGWREFLRSLGLEDSFLDILERRSDHDRRLSLYDGLQEYITLYPNTSLGFVINALSSTKQQGLIEKLAQGVKT